MDVDRDIAHSSLPHLPSGRQEGDAKELLPQNRRPGASSAAPSLGSATRGRHWGHHQGRCCRRGRHRCCCRAADAPPRLHVAEWAWGNGLPSWLVTRHLGAGQKLNPLFPSKQSEWMPWYVSQDCISLSRAYRSIRVTSHGCCPFLLVKEVEGLKHEFCTFNHFGGHQHLTTLEIWIIEE